MMWSYSSCFRVAVGGAKGPKNKTKRTKDQDQKLRPKPTKNPFPGFFMRRALCIHNLRARSNWLHSRCFRNQSTARCPFISGVCVILYIILLLP